MPEPLDFRSSSLPTTIEIDEAQKQLKASEGLVARLTPGEAVLITEKTAGRWFG